MCIATKGVDCRAIAKMNHEAQFEHVIKMNEDAFVKTVNVGRIEGGKETGRPPAKWVHRVN